MSRAERLAKEGKAPGPVKEDAAKGAPAVPAVPVEEKRKRPLLEVLGLVSPPSYAKGTTKERLDMEKTRVLQREQRIAATPVRPAKQVEADQKAIDDQENNLVAALRRVVHGDEAPTDKRNHLTLVELRYLMQLGRVPKAAWEPIAFLYMEGVKFRKWGFSFQRHYIESLLLTSQSVDGYRSDQLTRSLISEQTAKNNAASGLRAPSGQDQGATGGR